MKQSEPEPPISPRGAETRSRILRAALGVFGRDGYDQATTRSLAKAADVALPAIRYYFDNKEGLYLACAQLIVDRYQERVGEELQAVVVALEGGCTAADARGHLKWVMRRVTAIASDDDALAARSFVLREMTEQGPAFDLLYRELWQPGVRLTAALVARAQGKEVADREAHLHALMLHASLTAFSVTLPVSSRYLGDASTPLGELVPNAALELVDAQIDGLGAENERPQVAPATRAGSR